MDALPLHVTTTKTPLVEAAVCSNIFGLCEHRGPDPVKVHLLGSAVPDSSEDESETTATGTVTPETRTPSITAEPSSPAFVAEDALEAIIASTVARDTQKLLDSSTPAFIPEDNLLGCSTKVQQAPWHYGKALSIRSIPQWYTPDLFLEEIRDGGFRLHHDFDSFCMPHDYVSGLNFRYCVLNFPKESTAKEFEAAFHERTARLAPEEPALEVSPATAQDYSAMSTSSCPRQARFCPQCGSEADYMKFNFCSQCGTSLAQLRKQPLWG
mmetsp:Transcript_114367/g.334361  ORF Transcript_114367/g.334361 Transcript_114367/m.334361 type:complete len:268 (-) Transcript_114367:115-918(-)